MSALAGFIVIIAYQYLRPKKFKSLKANMDTVYKEACATHFSVAAETQPEDVQKPAHGKAVYTPETNLIASLACKGHVSELLQALDTTYQKLERRSMPSSNKALLQSSAILHVTAAVRACVSQKRFVRQSLFLTTAAIELAQVMYSCGAYLYMLQATVRNMCTDVGTILRSCWSMATSSPQTSSMLPHSLRPLMICWASVQCWQIMWRRSSSGQYVQKSFNGGLFKSWSSQASPGVGLR